MAQLPAGVKEVQRVAVPGGGYYVLGSDGGVFAISDEQGRTPQFYGSIPGLKGDSVRGRHQFNSGSLELIPGGGYRITDTEGRKYNFDTGFARGMGINVPDAAPPPNTLTTDPAFMAFLRASGLSMEAAANQVRQQTAALNAARDTAIGDIDFQAGESRRTAAGSRETRGVLRSSGTNDALDRVERQRLAARTAKENEVSSRIGGLNQGLAEKVLEQQRQAAERGLSTAQTQDVNAQMDQLKKKYAPQLGGLSI